MSRNDVVSLVGNPRPGSKTLSVISTFGTALAARLGLDSPTVIDLAPLAKVVFDEGHPGIDEALAAVSRSRVLLVATPVYKAAYTGLLKAFLDRFGPDALSSIVVVPLIIAGNPIHAAAADLHLRPLLAELGATLPARSLTLTESQLADLSNHIEEWLDTESTVVATSVGVSRAEWLEFERKES